MTIALCALFVGSYLERVLKTSKVFYCYRVVLGAIIKLEIPLSRCDLLV